LKYEKKKIPKLKSLAGNINEFSERERERDTKRQEFPFFLLNPLDETMESGTEAHV
jgi:hypothetical protein